MPAVAQLIVRLLLAFLLVAIGDKFATLKDYLKSVGIFTMLTYALGGIVYGLSNLIGLDLRNYGVLGVLMLSIAIFELVVWFVVMIL